MCEIQFVKPCRKSKTAEQITQTMNHAEVLTDEEKACCACRVMIKYDCLHRQQNQGPLGAFAPTKFVSAHRNRNVSC